MSDHGYLRFARANARFLGFGFTMAFASSVGQTFFIGVFGPAVRGEFGLSHTSWSAIYMAGTLLSAAALTWTGPQIDRLPLKRYTTLVCTALVIATAFMAQVSSAAWLVLAIFLLRQTGQGLARRCRQAGIEQQAVARGNPVRNVEAGDEAIELRDILVV